MKIYGSIAARSLLRSMTETIDGDPVLQHLIGNADRYLPGMIVESIDSDDWASLTFVGELHRVLFRLSGGALSVVAVRDRLDRLLVASEMIAPGCIVAEIAVTGCEMDGQGIVVVVDALTLVD